MASNTGVVKWFSSKGFGVIVPDRGGSELFAHIGDVDPALGTLVLRQRVRFEVAQNTNGPQAWRIRAAA